MELYGGTTNEVGLDIVPFDTGSRVVDITLLGNFRVSTKPVVSSTSHYVSQLGLVQTA